MLADVPADLSVCIIVKNDADRVRRAIDSVRALNARVLVTDTGSTDATPEAARDAGAEVETIEWRQDFSAAYNHVVRRAETEWVLSLDSDEWLPPESPPKIIAAIKRHDAMGYNLVRHDLRNVNDPDDFSQMWQLRLFRKRDATRYVGRIHHQFRPPLESIAEAEGRRVLDSDIVMMHDGYLNRDWGAKLRRDIELMDLELAERPGQFYFQVELGLAASRLNDPRAGEHLTAAARAAIDDAQRPTLPRGAFERLLEWTLATPELPEHFPITRGLAERWARSALHDAPPLAWQLSRLAFARGDYAEAARLLEHLLELGRTNAYDRTSPFDPRILGDDAKLNLGACYLRLARLDDAERVFRGLLSSERCRDAARQNLTQIQSLRAG